MNISQHCPPYPAPLGLDWGIDAPRVGGGFGVQGSGFGVKGSGAKRQEGLGSRLWGSRSRCEAGGGSRVEGPGSRCEEGKKCLNSQLSHERRGVPGTRTRSVGLRVSSLGFVILG